MQKASLLRAVCVVGLTIGACTVEIDSRAWVFLPPEVASQTKLLDRVLERLKSGDAAAAVRAAVPNVSDTELQSITLEFVDHMTTDTGAGPAIQCAIDIVDPRRGRPAVVACVEAASRLIESEVAKSGA